MEEILIWVDENDNQTGSGEKLYTHQIGQLHRAFSVFLYDREKQEMLIQKRAYGKYHSGGKWSNACCSHPRLGQTLEEAVEIRVPYELGVELKGTLVECGNFVYYADFGDLSEHELDHVFLNEVNKEEVAIDRFREDEIAELQWIGIKELETWMKDRSDDFSAWFFPAYEKVKPHINAFSCVDK